MIRNCDIHQVPLYVRDGNCVIKSKLYDLTKLVCDSETVEDLERRARVRWIGEARMMIRDFKQMGTKCR